MRKIEFRVWDKEGKCFTDKYSVCNGQLIDLAYGEVGDWDGAYDWVDGSNYVIMQFTGLLDKNGKGIWEGDIVKEVWSVHKVEYNLRYGFELFQRFDPRDLEIVGNIYENPELLEKEGS